MRAVAGAAALLAGLTFAASASAATDTVPPETTITPLAGGAFRFDANEQATFSCRLDGAAAKPCDEPLGVIAYGSHVLEATAIDTAGNADPTPAVYRWTTTAPPVENATPIVEASGPAATPSSESPLPPATPMTAPLRVRYTFRHGIFTRIWISDSRAKITITRPGKRPTATTIRRLVGKKFPNGTKITFGAGTATRTITVRGGRVR
jgi:hypothetical protein